MERKKIKSIIIPISLAFLSFFVLTKLFEWLSIVAFVLISIVLILYFAFLKVIQSSNKIWFFLMLAGFFGAGLFLLLFSPPPTVMIIPMLILFLWLVALVILYFNDIETAFFRPNIEKIALLVCFLVFTPSPTYVIFAIGYLPLFYFILSLIISMTDMNVNYFLSNIHIFVVIGLFNSIIGFAYYGIICSLERKSLTKILLLIMTAVLIVVAFSQKVYWERHEDTPMPDSTVIEIYRSLFTK